MDVQTRIQDEMLPVLAHSHLCPVCWRYVPCEMDCTLDGLECRDESGLLVQHPELCDDCGHPSAFLAAGFDPVSMGM